MRDLAVDHVSRISDITLLYESPFNWQKKPLLQFDSIHDATYPELVEVTTKTGTTLYFPENDMYIQEPNKPPLLFSGAHNRLLFESIHGEIMSKNPNRVLVNVDKHDDFFLGQDTVYNPRSIHVGNWGAAGILERQWSEIIHLSREYHFRGQDVIELHGHTIPLSSVDKEVSFAEVDLMLQTESLQLVLRLLENKHFIFTWDADEFTDWSPEFQQDIRNLMYTMCNQPGLDLIHFTPSPAHIGPNEAIPQWDLLREVYASL